MTKYTVYGISNWPESPGERFLVFEDRTFANCSDVLAAAVAEYGNQIEFDIVESD